MDIDQTKHVLLKDKLFMSLNEAAEYTGVGVHKLAALSDDPNCEFVFWIGRKRCSRGINWWTISQRLIQSD